jgi:hypothetical protein
MSWGRLLREFLALRRNGIDSVGAEGLLDDLWEYSNSQWTWITGSKMINQNGMYATQGMLAAGNIPGARSLAAP